MYYLLSLEREDRNFVTEEVCHLLFSVPITAHQFARQLASEYFGCGQLPQEGAFTTNEVKGEVIVLNQDLYITWTVQPKVEGGLFGDSYYLEVKPVQQYSEDTLLDFWNAH